MPIAVPCTVRGQQEATWKVCVLTHAHSTKNAKLREPVTCLVRLTAHVGVWHGVYTQCGAQHINNLSCVNPNDTCMQHMSTYHGGIHHMQAHACECTYCTSFNTCVQWSMITMDHDHSHVITIHDVVPYTTSSHVNALHDGYTKCPSHTHPCSGHPCVNLWELRIPLITLHSPARMQRM